MRWQSVPEKIHQCRQPLEEEHIEFFRPERNAVFPLKPTKNPEVLSRGFRRGDAKGRQKAVPNKGERFWNRIRWSRRDRVSFP